jgi:hypothetical protein
MQASPSFPVNPNTAVSKIPIEIQDFFLEGVDFPFSVAEAKALRVELNKEQESFIINHGETFENTIQFSL